MSSPSAISFQGLTDQDVEHSRAQHGWNIQVTSQSTTIFSRIFDALKEPMVVLLLLVSSIYFGTGDYPNGWFMLVAILLVVSISLYQENKSSRAIAALSQLTQPQCKVLRNGTWVILPSKELVIDDIFQSEEGTLIPADGILLQSNDFSVNESLLTGESLAVFKNTIHSDPNVYQGTVVASGLAICRVTAIGWETQLGKIGKSLESICENQTPLQIQIRQFVTNITLVGIVAFVMVWMIVFWQTGLFWKSVLPALTLAMSIIPEEIPVAFSTFMALGAWRLLQHGIIAKQTKTIETLGSATVICTDKTGTLTENRMSLAAWCTLHHPKAIALHTHLQPEEQELFQFAMWASEPIPFDAMEIALHEIYSQNFSVDERPNYSMIHEYPLGGQPPMMTHVFENTEGHRIIACKGAAEALLQNCPLSNGQRKELNDTLLQMTQQGFRVLGVANSVFQGTNFPEDQKNFPWEFRGLIAFYDPPKANSKAVIENFYEAGLDVKIISGDHAATTVAIAKQIGIREPDRVLNGPTLMALSDEELKEKVQHTTLFARMFPEAKLRIIEALKANQHIVAMTGDGMNDGPALKSAHIGIAMGKKGTEIAKQAANLVLVDDDLSKMIEGIAMGRKIYLNLKKAIQYIISIHLPIVLIVLLPLALQWQYPTLFTPVHVIFLEIIMGPTCSIIYENEPLEAHVMQQKPRPLQTTFFKWKEIALSLVQGILITLGLLFCYQLAMQHSFSEDKTRSMVFVTLILSNVFLTLVNRSFYFSVLTTLKYHNPMIPIIITVTLGLTALLQFVPWCARFFQLEPLGLQEWLWCIGCGALSVFWIEGYKLWKRIGMNGIQT